MTNLEKYNEAFTTVFSVSAKDLNDEFNAGNIDSWVLSNQLKYCSPIGGNIRCHVRSWKIILGLTSLR